MVRTKRIITRHLLIELLEGLPHKQRSVAHEAPNRPGPGTPEAALPDQ